MDALLACLKSLRGLDPLMPSPFGVALLECVWDSVLPDKKSLARFLIGEGLEHLLALLDQGSKSQRPVILSMLADIMENPKAHPFFHDWRSHADRDTAAHMLLRLWAEEDALRGMTDGDGQLANTMRPLAGTSKRSKWVPAESIAYGSISPGKKETMTLLLEASTGDSLLAKIYSVFRLLGFDRFPYLSPQDKAQLAVVEKYLKFRQGEVWQEIAAELEASGLRPTAPDRERLASGIELCEHLAAAVRDAQGSILGSHQDTLRAAEAKFFEDMKAQKRLEHEMRFLGADKTAMNLSELRAAKAKKEAMLEKSAATFKYDDTGLDADLAAAASGAANATRLATPPFGPVVR